MLRWKYYECDQSLGSSTRAGNAEQGRYKIDPLAIRLYLFCGYNPEIKCACLVNEALVSDTILVISNDVEAFGSDCKERT